MLRCRVFDGREVTAAYIVTQTAQTSGTHFRTVEQPGGSTEAMQAISCH